MGYAFLLIVMLVLLWPVLEIMAVIYAVHYLGFAGTIALLLAGMIGGVLLMRWQGFETWQRIATEVRAGRVPTDAIADGMLLFVAGILLVLPGLLSDTVAMLLLIPWSRNLIKFGLSSWFGGNVVVQTHVSGQPNEDVVIDSYVVRDRTEQPVEQPLLEGPREAS